MKQIPTFDVLVVGSGIAGTAAAMAASEERPGARIAIASLAPLFSGSSFATTTWLLGLISPGGAQGDQDDLARRILEVGDGCVNATLVRDFAGGIEDAVLRAQSWGVEFLEPSAEARGEKEYVACFDDTMRHWRGLVRSSWREALRPLLAERGVVALEGIELLDLELLGDGSSAATFFSHQDESFVQTRQGAIILATGGTASLWPRNIAGRDAQATVHAIACHAGAKLTNMASIQFMPTIISPVDNVVFNEKAFRFMEFPAAAIREIERELPGGYTFSDALAERSGYGPYSGRLPSKAVDHAICRAGKDGLALVPRIGPDAPELIRRYLDWLIREYGVSADAPLRIALRAQASNGGIVIGADGSTGARGVYAAGECTGGMHGRDRIGGLSSANALTFGIKAGTAAARYGSRINLAPCEPLALGQQAPASSAQQAPASSDQQATALSDWKTPASPDAQTPASPDWQTLASPDWAEAESELQDAMRASFGPLRSERGMENGRRKLALLANNLALSAKPSSNAREIALTRRTALRIETAQAIAASAPRATE